jgi:hypothetical protein
MMQSLTTGSGGTSESELTTLERGVNQTMKNSKFWKMIKKFLEDEAADEYNGDTLGMYIGGTIGTLLMVAMILYGGM